MAAWYRPRCACRSMLLLDRWVVESWRAVKFSRRSWDGSAQSRRSPVYNGNDDCRALVARCIRLGGRAAGTAAALPSYTLVSSAAGTTNRSAPWHAEFSFHPRREWSGRGCDPSQQCCDHSGSVVCRSSPAVQFGLFQVGIGLLAACCPANTWRRAVFCARRHSDSLSSPIPGMDAGVWRLSVLTMR